MTEEEIRRRIATLMADGRERTLSDITNRLKISQEWAKPALLYLLKKKLISSRSYKLGPDSWTIYRRAMG